MNDLPRPKMRPTGLRDFGAFSVNLADIDTHALKAINFYSHQDRVLSDTISLVAQSTINEMAGPTTPVPSGLVLQPSQLNLREPSPQVIPFPTQKVTPGWYRQLTAMVHKIAKKKGMSVAVRVVLTVLIFSVLFRSLSWSTLFSTLVHMHRGVALAALPVGITGIVFSTYQWHSLLQGERIRFDLSDLVNLYLVGIAFNHFFPTGMGGDAIKAMHVGRDSNNHAGSTSAVLMCRITGFLGMLLVSFPVMIIWYTHFTTSIIVTFLLLSLLVGSIIGGAFFSVTLLPKIFKGKWVNNRLTQHHIFNSVTRVGDALRLTVKRPRTMLLALLYGIAFWIVCILNCYSYGNALSLHAPLYIYFIAIPLTSLVTFLPISINGFGLRESVLVFAFSTVHVAAPGALLLAFLIDLQTILFGIFGGCLYLFSRKQKKSEKRWVA